MATIKPTVGRRVWYYPATNEKRMSMLPFHLHGDGPLDAGIAHVNDDGTVNLSVFDSIGNHHSRQKVRFIDNDETGMPTDGDAYAAWMPFQLGQARAPQQAQAHQETPPLAPPPAPAPAPVAQVEAPPLAPQAEPQQAIQPAADTPPAQLAQS